MVRLAVCASFEFSPMLGKGEPLRILDIRVGELLSRTERKYLDFLFCLAISQGCYSHHIL